ncbi:MAG: spondin domain-containing protein [Alcanivoracaceae bacterium]|nr:spondin domain-containing protein [Alcanivoracaceae bacterium]
MKNVKIFTKLFIPIAMAATFSLQATEIKVKVEVLTPTGGVFVTPLWVGFHDGSFDSYDTGAPASTAIERLAEDGDVSELSALFVSSTNNAQDDVILNPQGFAGAPVFEPGSSSSMVFDLDESSQRYFSYATMIIPSNDAFVANANPLAHQLFDEDGDFFGPFTFTVYGTQVRDAGTEENTESDAAFLNQTAANTGNSTEEAISVHPGFNGSVGNPNASPVNILGGTVASGDVIDAVNGDFTNDHYPIMRITISKNSTPVRVTIKNSAMQDGTFLTPFWAAFHDGEFDTYDLGFPASAGLEQIAEDGDSTTLRAEFAAIGGGFDTVITNPAGFAGAPLFDPGLSTQAVFELDPTVSQYFSYATMLLPSNDAFIANADPKQHKIFDDNGDFNGAISIKIYGSQVRDAGTEENTESDAPFFNQSAANTGVTTSENVTVHAGYNGSLGNPDATPQVFLGGTNPPGFTFDQVNADFTTSGYQVAEIAISRLVDGSFSGTWFDPERLGEGFVIDVTSDTSTGEARAVVSWYTYAADGSARQSWLIGTGPVIADTILADMNITDGANFGNNFNSEDVINTPWGQVSIKFNSCDSATVTFNSLDANFGSGSYQLQRLTTGPVDYKGACQL